MKPADRQHLRFDLTSRQELRSLPSFRGPGQTLVLFDPWLEAWLITGWDGGEVLVSEADLEAFLEHCARHLGSTSAPVAGKDTRTLVSYVDDQTETPETEPDPDAETTPDA